MFYGIWNDVDGCFDLFVVCQRTALDQATVRVRETAGDVTHRGLALQRLGTADRVSSEDSLLQLAGAVKGRTVGDDLSQGNQLDFLSAQLG